MCRESCAVGPLLEEHQLERILAVDMYGVRDATRLLPRPMDVFEAEVARLVKRLGPGGYTASYHDHAKSPDVNAARAGMLRARCPSLAPAASVSAPRVR